MDPHIFHHHGVAVSDYLIDRNGSVRRVCWQADHVPIVDSDQR